MPIQRAMNGTVRQVVVYAAIGVANTAIHALVFLALLHGDWAQGTANLGAFLVAATFSFFANQRLTFRKRFRLGRYILFLALLGLIAYGVGHMAERVELEPLLTVAIFTLVSFVLGFTVSKYVVFRDVP